MDPVVSIGLPLALWALSAVLARREWRHYKADDDSGSDLFVYSKGRSPRVFTCCARSWRTFSTSATGNVGRSSTSTYRSQARARLREGACQETAA